MRCAWPRRDASASSARTPRRSPAPFGAAKPFLGTNPLAIAVPAGRHPPFTLDMATAEGSRKKIRKALAEGKPIPAGWALGPDGQPTTDPQAALDGVMLPFGGVKGSGVALLVDLLSGVLSGAEFGGRVLSVMTNQERESGNGHFILAFRADAFLPGTDVAARMDEEIDRMKALPPGRRSTRVSLSRRAGMASDRRTQGQGNSSEHKNNLRNNRAGCSLFVVTGLQARSRYQSPQIRKQGDGE